MQNWLTAEEAAEVLGYNVEFVRRQMRKGRLRGKKLGNIWLVEFDAIKDLRTKLEKQ